MVALLPALLLIGTVDGQAALDHASKLAALGPHPWGSPRARFAAEYVASRFRAVGLEEVRLQDFESHGIRGTNVIGVLRAPGPEFVVVGAHHDTAPDAPGAYDDGGGVGVLIEVARVAAQGKSRTRTLVFASWDGEEAWSTGLTTTSGSRAYIQSLGPESRSLVAALVIEMCGWKGGTPVFHPIAYAHPLQPGRYAVTPAWLFRAAQAGAREGGEPLAAGDPLIPWLYQTIVRTFRVRLYGDDLSFLQNGLPAVFASDSSFSAYYPWYHQPSDTADKLDAASLARMGRGILGVVTALRTVPRGPAMEPMWFTASGHVLGGGTLLMLGLLSVAPCLWAALRAGGVRLGARLLQAALFGVLLWRHPVPALWVFAVPNLLTVGAARWWTAAVASAPLLTLLGLGAAAWRRGMISGIWLAPWEVVLAGLAIALLWLPPATPRGPATRKRR